MTFFGIGPLEIVLIGVIALIVFGPERLPEIMRQVGHAIRQFQQISGSLTDEFQKTLNTDILDPARPAAPETPPVPAAVATQVPTPPTTVASSEAPAPVAYYPPTPPAQSALPASPSEVRPPPAPEDDLLPPY